MLAAGERGVIHAEPERDAALGVDAEVDVGGVGDVEIVAAAVELEDAVAAARIDRDGVALTGGGLVGAAGRKVGVLGGGRVGVLKRPVGDQAPAQVHGKQSPRFERFEAGSGRGGGGWGAGQTGAHGSSLPGGLPGRPGNLGVLTDVRGIQMRRKTEPRASLGSTVGLCGL
ncbi:MAG: hypothetical protein AAF086_04485 [Planctomycetota bacterium]